GQRLDQPLCKVAVDRIELYRPVERDLGETTGDRQTENAVIHVVLPRGAKSHRNIRSHWAHGKPNECYSFLIVGSVSLRSAYPRNGKRSRGAIMALGDFTLGDVYRRNAQFFPNNAAFIFGKTRTTHLDYLQRIRKVAAG